MKNISSLMVAALATIALSLVGCSGSEFSIAPVSGKVTSEGNPVPNLRLVFTPVPNEANTDPGPWSTGVTNENGEYVLETRYKNNGAAIGKHTVSFEFEAAAGEDIEELKEDLESALEEGEKEEFEAIKSKIAELKKKSKGRPKFGEEFTLHIEVPKGGTKEADFDLPK